MRGASRTLPGRAVVGAVVFVIGVVAAAIPATGQEPEIVSKWEIAVGSVFTNVDTDIRADANRVDLGTDIDFEDALGFDDTETLLRLNVRRRLKKRHYVAVDIQEMSRSAARDIPFEIEFEDVVFPSTVRVSSDWDMRLLDLRYAYMPVLKEKTAVALTAGVGRWDYDVELAATEQQTGRTLRSEVDVDELVPLFGVGVRQQLTPKLHLDAGLQALSFDLGETSGSIVESNVGFSYWFHRHVGLALSFYYLNADIGFDDDRKFIGAIDYELSGIQLFIPIRFD